MPRNIAGTYSLPTGINPVVTGTVITAEWANETMQDIADALSDSLSRSGLGGMDPAAQFFIGDGTLNNPGLAFTSQDDMGLWREATNKMHAAMNGANIFSWYVDKSVADKRLEIAADLLHVVAANVNWKSKNVAGALVFTPSVSGSTSNWNDEKAVSFNPTGIVDFPVMPTVAGVPILGSGSYLALNGSTTMTGFLGVMLGVDGLLDPNLAEVTIHSMSAQAGNTAGDEEIWVRFDDTRGASSFGTLWDGLVIGQVRIADTVLPLSEWDTASIRVGRKVDGGAWNSYIDFLDTGIQAQGRFFAQRLTPTLPTDLGSGGDWDWATTPTHCYIDPGATIDNFLNAAHPGEMKRLWVQGAGAITIDAGSGGSFGWCVGHPSWGAGTIVTILQVSPGYFLGSTSKV